MDSSSTGETSINENPKDERKDDTEHSENLRTVEPFAKTGPVISPEKSKHELTVKDETKGRRSTEYTRKNYDENIVNQKNVKDAVSISEHSEKSQMLLPSATEIHEMEDNADKDRGIVTEAGSSILQDAVLTDVNMAKSEPHMLSATEFSDRTKESKKDQSRIIQAGLSTNKADFQITSKPEFKVSILQTESAQLCLSDEPTLSKSDLSNKLLLKNIDTSSTCDRVDSSDLKEEIVKQCDTKDKFACKSKITESRSVIVENPNKEKARIDDMRTKKHETDTIGNSKSQEYSESFQKYEKRLLSGSQIISPVKRKSDLTAVDDIKRRRNNLGEKCENKSSIKTLNVSDTLLSLEIFCDTSETAMPLTESIKEETLEKHVETAKHVDESTSKESSRQSKNKTDSKISATQTSTLPSMSRNFAQFEGLAARFIAERKPVSLNKSLHSDTFNQSEGSHSKESRPEYPVVIPTNDCPNSSPKVIVEMVDQKSKLSTAKNKPDSNRSDNKTDKTERHDIPFDTMSKLFTSVINKEFLESCRNSEAKKPEDPDINTSFQEKVQTPQENHPRSTFTENTKKHFPAKSDRLFRSMINRELLKISQNASLESTEKSDKKPEDPDLSESFQGKVPPIREYHSPSTLPSEESCSRTLPRSSAHADRNHLHPIYLEQESKFVPVELYENDPEIIESQKQILASFEQQSTAKQKENLEPKKKEPRRSPIKDSQLKRQIIERVSRSRDTLDIFLENHALLLMLFLLKSNPEAFENTTELETLVENTYAKLWDFLCLATEVVRKWGKHGNNASASEFGENEGFPDPVPNDEENNPPNSLLEMHGNDSPKSLPPENETSDIPDFLIDDVPPLLSPIRNETDQTTDTDYPEYREYPGLAEEPAKVKKDARYQKKFYKQKPIKLPANWTFGNSSTERDFDVNSENNDPRILRKFGNRKFEDEKTGEVVDGRSPIYDLRTLAEINHTREESESRNNDDSKTLESIDGYKMSSFMEESPTSPIGSSKSNRSDHSENKDSPTE